MTDFWADLMSSLFWEYMSHISVAVVVFVFVMCFFALWKPNSPWGRALVSNATTLITTAGIFFTFLGISISLFGFDIDKIDAGISQILKGMQVAFFSSVAGLFFSLIYRFIRIFFFSRTDRASNDTNAADIHTALLENNKAMNKGFSELADALGGDKDTSVAGQLTRLRTTTQDKLDTLTDEFKKFAETIAENNSKALIEALESVIRDFNTKLTEQFGENFKQLNAAVGKLVEWQENYRQQMEELREAFNHARDNLEKSSTSMTNIDQAAQRIPEHLDNLEGVYKKLSEQLGELSERLEAFSNMKESAEAAFPAIQGGLDKLTGSLQEQMGGLTENLKENFGDLTNRIGENLDGLAKNLEEGIDKSLEKVQSSADTQIEALEIARKSVDELSNLSRESVQNSEKLSEESRKLVNETAVSLDTAIKNYNERVLKMIAGQDEEYKKLVAGTAQRMEEGVKDGIENLKGVVSDLDKEMEQEVQRVVQLMGANITAITDEFVTQYERLFDGKRKMMD